MGPMSPRYPLDLEEKFARAEKYPGCKLQPVEDYLKLQGWFRHLFEPPVQTAVIAHIQEMVNAYWAQEKNQK